MNSLRRNILPGEVVIVARRMVNVHQLEHLHGDLRFVALTGSGLSRTAFGTTIYGYWWRDKPADGLPSTSLDGRGIDWAETKRYQDNPQAWEDDWQARWGGSVR